MSFPPAGDQPPPPEDAGRPPGRRPAGRIPLRRRRAWAWLRLLRPIATLSGAGVAVGFAFILEDGAPVWHEASRLGLVMFAVLAAASAMNDYLDRHHDRDAHIWRPLATDLIAPRDAARLAAALAVIAVAAGASLGWRPFLLTLAGLAAAALYNARLRNTPLSWLPLAVAFALVPVWAAEAVDRFDDVLWWSLPVGLLAGLTAHLAIKLPDYERDDVRGAQSLMHWMTIDFAVPMTWGLMGAYVVVAVASANVETLRVEWIAPPAAIAITATLLVMGVGFFGVTERKLVWQRWLFSGAIVSMAIGWLGSVAP